MHMRWSPITHHFWNCTYCSTDQCGVEPEGSRVVLLWRKSHVRLYQHRAVCLGSLRMNLNCITGLLSVHTQWVRLCAFTILVRIAEIRKIKNRGNFVQLCFVEQGVPYKLVTDHDKVSEKIVSDCFGALREPNNVTFQPMVCIHSTRS